MSVKEIHTIGELGVVVTGKTPSSQNPDQWGSEMPFITPSDFDSYHKNIFQSERYLSDVGIQQFQKKILPPNSILVTCIGSQMGKVAINRVECVTNQQINSIILRNDINPDFLYYKLCTMQSFLRGLATGGSTMPIINKTDFEKIQISLPDLPTQTAIAEILSSLDDKIELNNQINQNLEALAQAIFKRWFVDFEFPNENGQPYKSSGGEMMESELGKIPKGWTVGTFEDLIEFINGYAFKSDSLLREDDGQSYAVFKMGNIRKGGGFQPDSTKSYFPKSKSLNLEKFILKKGDLLMCMTDMKGNVALLGHTALMDQDDKYLVNQRVGLLRARNSVAISFPYLYLLTNHPLFLNDLRSRANSGVQVNLATTEIKNTKVLLPPKWVNSLFHTVVVAMFESTFSNQKENQQLRSLRDLLLPRLITGELTVSACEPMVADL